MKHMLHLEVNQYETMTEALSELKKKGYPYSFKITKGKALCLETKKEIDPKTITIVEYHRFEGDSDPGDMAVIFVVECDDGTFGCIIDAYGTYADNQLSDFLTQVKIAPRTE